MMCNTFGYVLLEWSRQQIGVAKHRSGKPHPRHCQTRILAAFPELTTEEIQRRQIKHIAEISKHLANKRIRSEYPTFEQQEWLNFRMARLFPKPYIPWPWTKKEFKFKTFSFAEVFVSVKPLTETD